MTDTQPASHVAVASSRYAYLRRAVKVTKKAEIRAERRGKDSDLVVDDSSQVGAVGRLEEVDDVTHVPVQRIGIQLQHCLVGENLSQ